MIFGPIKAGIILDRVPGSLFVHEFIGSLALTPVVSRPDTETLLGCGSLRLLDKSPKADRCSGLDPRGIWVEQPCRTSGLAAAHIVLAPQIGFKTHRRKVIHRLATLRFGCALLSSMHNFADRIRVARNELPWVIVQ